MAWTTPKTNWATGELVAAGDMNAIGENLAALGSVREAVGAYKTTEDITAGVREFTDIDSSNLSLTITTTGGDVLVHFHGSVGRFNGGRTGAEIDLDVDGDREGGDSGILKLSLNDQVRTPSFTRLIQNLRAGSHTFKLQWKQSNSAVGARLFAGAQFWVREV